MHSPTVGSWEGGVSYERGTPVPQGERSLDGSRQGCSTLNLIRKARARMSSWEMLHLRTTPESLKGSPKVNFPLKALVFKSGKRVLTRI